MTPQTGKFRGLGPAGCPDRPRCAASAGCYFRKLYQRSFAGRNRIATSRGPYLFLIGDGALSFGPVSAQGIFSALHGGLRAAEAVIASESEGQDQDALEAYGARLESIRRIYLARWRDLYDSELRWPGAAFWSTTG